MGSEHPLARTLERLAVVGHQLPAVGIVLVAGAAAAAVGVGGAGTIALSAALVLVGLGAIAAFLSWEGRRRAIDAIVDGYELVPLAVIGRERRRLLDPNTRGRLASRFEWYARSATEPHPLLTLAPRAFTGLMPADAVLDELRQLAASLREPPMRARGVASAERVLSQGLLIAHGHDAAGLRDELRRAIDMLAEAGDRPERDAP